ncbi:MAG: alpha/beta hydrolase [Alphaproteobacteria bacterium]|nr:alpha/beta hydrolase [Alphaproteobacteria bacterium]
MTFTVPAPFGLLTGTLYSSMAGASTPPVVIWPSIFSTASVQSDLIALLSRTSQVLAIDPPGHGASRIDVVDFLTMPACADATFMLLDEAGLQTVAWVGTSWGGLVGVEAALLKRSRLVHLTCLNTPFTWHGPGWGKPRWLPLMVRTIGRTRVFADGVAGDFFLPSTRNDPTRAKAMLAHDRTFLSGDLRQLSAAAHLIFGTRADAMPLLPKLDVPTLVIAGHEDRLYPVSMQRKAAAMIAGARFEAVDSAHIAAVDCPQTIADLLLNAWSAS